MKQIKFKNTEVGMIPEDWGVKPLGKLCKVNGRIGFRGYNKTDLVLMGMGAYTIGGKHITHNVLDLSDPDFISWEKYYESPEIMVKKGDIVMAQRGTLGRAAYIKDDIGPATINPSLVLLNHIKCNAVFMHYVLSSEKYSETIIQTGSQTSVPMISQAQIEGINLPMPPTNDEQRHIATALSDVDELISTLKKLIEKKQNIKKGAMQELLSGKSRLPGFTDEWIEGPVSEFVDFHKGNGLSKGKLVPNGKNACILYGEIFTTYNYEVVNCISHTNCNEGTPSVKGDVLMPGSTTTEGIDLAKAICVYEDNILLGGDIIILRNAYDKYDPLFLAYYITEILPKQVAEVAQGTTIIHLQSSKVGKLKLSIPFDKSEQRAIVAILSDMESEIKTLEKRLTKYQSLKQGMMQQLLTGKIRLI